MKVLYAAIDQRVPGTDGGAVHVKAVATGLASRGHEVHVLTAQGSGRQPDSAHWHAMRPPLGVRQLRLLQTPRIVRLARELCPEVVIERYYNFGGEGILAARAVGALTVLEVNAPVIDYPGSKKRLLDRLLLVEPMRRWQYWQCAHADLIVTPTATILPPWVDPDAVVELEWGADTKRFHPGAIGPVPFDRQPGEIVVVFAGAFRPWHGAINLRSSDSRAATSRPAAGQGGLHRTRALAPECPPRRSEHTGHRIHRENSARTDAVGACGSGRRRSPVRRGRPSASEARLLLVTA